MWITDFFSEPGQSILRNALETATLVQAIIQAYLSRRREQRREKARRRSAEGRGKAGRRRQAGAQETTAQETTAQETTAQVTTGQGTTGQGTTGQETTRQGLGEGRDAAATAPRVREHQPQTIRMPLSSRPSRAIPSQRRIAALTLPPHTVTARKRVVETETRPTLAPAAGSGPRRTASGLGRPA
jgi:hypothetical protein